jgi:hypothetical protein
MGRAVTDWDPIFQYADPLSQLPPAKHAKSVENPDWPHESYCTLCGEEWPCPTVVARSAHADAPKETE